jgi:HPt (histidine-containing phosphotransfer) domain-containing protein
MPEYKGQPDYVIVGYQSDLLEMWAEALDNDDWGESIRAMHQLLEGLISVSDEARALVIVGWIREELQRAWDEDWWDTKYDYADWVGIYKAQDAYEKITKEWRQRAKTFKGEDALEEVIAGLPDWIRPGPDRLEKPDKEREQYEKLKAKFEPGG